jgi:hypothetical protein
MNRHRHANAVPVAGITKWIVVVLFLGIAGLSYVHFKNQQHATGSEIKTLERQFADLQSQNDIVRAKISQLSSRNYLQRRLAEGFIHMTPIKDDRIVRINADPLHSTAEELQAMTKRIVAKK